MKTNPLSTPPRLFRDIAHGKIKTDAGSFLEAGPAQLSTTLLFPNPCLPVPFTLRLSALEQQLPVEQEPSCPASLSPGREVCAMEKQVGTPPTAPEPSSQPQPFLKPIPKIQWVDCFPHVKAA